MVVFEADYDEIKLQNYSYDVISVTSSPLRYRKNVTKIMSQLVFEIGLLSIKISGCASGLGLII